MSNEQLVEQIRNGNYVTENMQRLYENNLPLLRKFIKPYIHLEPEEDLLQEAFFGLHEAVQHYESSENVLFMTYAYYWIRQSVVKYIENCGSIIRWPAGFKQKMNRYNKSVREFVQEYGRFPTDWEMAEALGISLQEVGKIKIALQEVASLEAPVSEDGELTLGDCIADKYSLEDDVIDENTQRTFKMRLVVDCGALHGHSAVSGYQRLLQVRYDFEADCRAVGNQHRTGPTV